MEFIGNLQKNMLLVVEGNVESQFLRTKAAQDCQAGVSKKQGHKEWAKKNNRISYPNIGIPMFMETLE